MTNSHTHPMRKILFILIFALLIDRVGLSLAQLPDGTDEPLVVRPAEKVQVFIEHSENGKYVARHQLADQLDAAALVQIFEFDAKLRRYHSYKQLRLPNSQRQQLLLTNDGRYLVALNNIFPKETTSNALFIQDLQENKSRSFALADFLPKATLAKLESDKMMMAIINWIEQIKLVDKEHKLYVNPDSSNSKFPSVVVDLQAMTATWNDPSAKSPPLLHNLNRNRASWENRHRY